MILISSKNKQNEIIFISERIVSLMFRLPNLIVDINQRDGNGINAFWIAAYYNHSRLLRMLSDLGIDRLVKNDIGSNALHIAVKRGNCEAIEEMIVMDFPLDIPKANGVTALGIAIHGGDLKIVEQLIKGGSDVNFISIKPNPGISSMSLALKHKN
jgi:potassium channel